MPYSPSEVSRSIATEVVVLEIAFAKRWIKATDPWGIVGMLTKDGVGYAGQPVYVQYFEVAENRFIDLAGGPYTTGSDGRWSMPIMGPGYGWGCKDLRMRARYGTYYSREGMLAIAFPTRVTISAPDKITPGTSFTVTGKLEYENPQYTWNLLPPPAKYVNLYKDWNPVTKTGTYIGSQPTDANGIYLFTTSITTSTTLAVTFEPLMPTTLFFAPSIGEWTWWSPLDLVSILAPATPVIVVGTMVAWDALRHK